MRAALNTFRSRCLWTSVSVDESVAQRRERGPSHNFGSRQPVRSEPMRTPGKGVYTANAGSGGHAPGQHQHLKGREEEMTRKRK